MNAPDYGHTEHTYTGRDLLLLKECVEMNPTLRSALIAFQSIKKCSYESLVEFWLAIAEHFKTVDKNNWSSLLVAMMTHSEQEAQQAAKRTSQ